MFQQRHPSITGLVLVTAALLLTAGPGVAQHGGFSYGGYRHGGYGGYSHGYSPRHYGGYYGHAGYYPGHYGYYRHYGYYPSYSHYGPNYYGGYYAYPRGSYHGYVPYYYGYSPGYYPYSAPAVGYQAYYPPDTAEGPTAPAAPAGVDRVVHFDVRVPADAAIWFDGVKTTQNGSAREFVSPPLAPGREYTYEIRARWKMEGREVSQSQRVTVRAGERVSVSFPTREKGSAP